MLSKILLASIPIRLLKEWFTGSMTIKKLKAPSCTLGVGLGDVLEALFTFYTGKCGSMDSILLGIYF